MNHPKAAPKRATPATGLSTAGKRVIERQALPDELADRLRDMIVRGELRPGSRINTPLLCSRFGVSRTPLREALQMLATDGLVLLMPNRSAVVRQVTDEMINELVPIVGTLEALAGRIACARISEEAVAELTAMHERLLHHLDQRDERSYMEAETAILRGVFAVAGNKSLAKLYETLTIKLQWQAVCHRAIAEWQQTAQVQQQMLHALKTGDGDLWALVAYRHVLHRAALLLRSTETRSSGKAKSAPGWET